MSWMLLRQAQPGVTEIVDALERVAVMQTIMAVSFAIIAVFMLGGLVFALLAMRSLQRKVHEYERVLEPKVLPLLDRASAIAADVTNMTDNTKRKVDDLLFTLEQINRSVRHASDATEERVRRFAAVIDVVQTEAEELLLDAAATARGVHETARLLHEPPPRPAGRPRPEAAPARAGRAATDETQEAVHEGS